MANKTTYIYRVELTSTNNKILGETKYCYARNASVVKEFYKNEYKKYDHIKTIPFGTADINIHPGPFEELPEEEVRYILQHNIGQADAYSNNRNPSFPFGGQFVKVDEI